MDPQRDDIQLHPYDGQSQLSYPRGDFEVTSNMSYDSGYPLYRNGADVPTVIEPYQYDDGDDEAFTKMSSYASQNGYADRNVNYGDHSVTSHEEIASRMETIDREKPFTVERKDEDTHLHRWSKKPSRALSACKLVVAFIFGVIMLLCVIASKMTMITIAKQLNRTYTSINGTEKTFFTCKSVRDLNNCKRETSFVMICLVLMIPPAFTVLKMFMLTCRKITHPWPTKLAVLWGAIGTTLESCGISIFFTAAVYYVKDTDLIVILMNALFIIPGLWQLFKEFQAGQAEKDWKLSAHLQRKRAHIRRRNILLTLLSFVLQTGGLIGVIYFAFKHNDKQGAIYLVPIAIGLLSIAWSPKMRKVQIDHDLAYVWSDVTDSALEQSKLPKAHRVRYFRSSTGYEETDGAEKQSKKQAKKKSMKDDANKVVLQTNTSRGKASMINALLKLILTPLFVTAWVYAFELADVTKVYEGIRGISHDRQMLVLFIVQVVASFLGYHLASISCKITLQRLCFAIPLTLSTPVCVIIVLIDKCQYFGIGECDKGAYDQYGEYVALLSVAVWLGQFFATTYYAWKSQDFIMADEATLFWVPSYEGSMLEQSLLLNRKNEATNDFYVNYRTLVKKSAIYICTTMYHEADYEMEQLLYSIAGVDRARRSDGRQFEAHVWFDDGVRDKTLKHYAIQLISLLETTVQVKAGDGTKLDTPYGMQMKWVLPGGMPFHIHLKDNFKVKNKKRWSQVMYMSYVLDFRERGNQDYSFILTTDADVKFHPEDVTALMDFMSRDPSVGAVCGRTHPLGSGPLVWYQVFDYAIGHWLLKVAEHVLGSVLCSPGCFSVYRCRALQDILPTYASSVECALDFLTKDMGEDRWLCTLMVERGWRLEYCAAAQDSTYCPTEFDEFFKQRRRWGPSTLANQAVLIQKQFEIRRNNDDINLLFVVYQVLMLFSTIIGPGTVLLLVSSGLQAAYPGLINLTSMFMINLTVAIGFILVCVYLDQGKQLQIAKILTFLYAVMMVITVVGLMIQVADDLDKQRRNGTAWYFHNMTRGARDKIIELGGEINTLDYPEGKITNPNATWLAMNRGVSYFSTGVRFQFTPPTLFLFFLIGLFMITAFLHGSEGFQLVHGIWYLLCLPSGYVFLMIYSLANLTDRSWGTRESAEKKGKSPGGEGLKWNHWIWFHFKEIFFCCFQAPPPPEKDRGDTQSEYSEAPSGFGGDSESIIEDPLPTDDDGDEEGGSKDGQDPQDDQSPGDEAQPKKKRGKSMRKSTRRPIQSGSQAPEETESQQDQETDTEDPYFDPRKSIRFAKSHNRLKRFPTQRRPTLNRTRSYYQSDPAEYNPYGNVYNQNGMYMGDAEADANDYFITMNIDDWLDGPYAVYIKVFKDFGYDDTTFLMGMKEPDLLEMGISNRGHRKKILAEIDRLPPEEIDQDVPEDVQEWLLALGLLEYWPKFIENSYAEPNALADLKLMDKDTLRQQFHISKAGHVKKLMKAIRMLKYPTIAQRKIRQSKLALEQIPTQQLTEENPEEWVFWDRLRKVCLLTEQGAFSQSEELHAKLFELRNTVLAVFAVANILWLTIMLAILSQGEKLSIFNTNFLSVAFLVIYTIVLGAQFITLLIHRVSTWLHFLARTPFKPGDKKHNAWSFVDEDLPPEPSNEDVLEVQQMMESRMRRRSKRRTISAQQRAKEFAEIAAYKDRTALEYN